MVSKPYHNNIHLKLNNNFYFLTFELIYLIHLFSKLYNVDLQDYKQSINNKKTDYNDLAQAGKTHQIAQDINRALEPDKNIAQKSTEPRESQIKQPARYRDMEMEFLG